MKVMMLCLFLVNLIMTSSYGGQSRKDIDEKFACITEYWMLNEFDKRVKDFCKRYQSNFIVKLVNDKGLGDEVKKLSTMPLHLGSFVLSNSKRIMNNFIQAIDGFDTNDIYYGDTDVLCTENKHQDKLGKAGLIGKKILQRKNEYKDGVLFYALFLAPKLKYSLTLNKIW